HDHDAAARADDIVTVTDGQVSTARSQEALA
ncbi:ABC transporter ATP-binding protein, partial [Lactobacillus paracasei]|nr:ABC transporter ATP-binding protein [Lacticaseibacillus paracasei]